MMVLTPIKVSDRLPDELGNYNVKHKDGELSRQYFNGTGFINFKTFEWNYFADIVEWWEESASETTPIELHEQYKKGYKDGFKAGVEDTKFGYWERFFNLLKL